MSFSHSWPLNHAKRALRGGGIIAYPTEAVWGLGCSPWNEEAAWRLCKIKKRPIDKGLIVVAANLQQLEPFIEPLSAANRDKLQATWPGATTWLLPVKTAVPEIVTGGASVIAVRVSAHPLVNALCKVFGGAIISSSANPSGRSPAKTALQVRRYFPQELDYIVNGELGGLEKPTQIIDLETGHIHR